LLLLSLSKNFPSLGFSLSIESKDRSSERPRVLDQQIEENLVEAQASKRNKRLLKTQKKPQNKTQVINVIK
jgi:hypothetical protein